MTTELLFIMILAALVLLGAILFFVLGMRERGGADEERMRREFETVRETLEKSGRHLRGEVGNTLKQTTDSLQKNLSDRLDQLGKTQIEQLKDLRESNEKRLEKMRETVDEKLQGTLEKRLGEAFKQVSERLETVQKGLGEMRQLASDVGDFKKVLTNVKSRGSWGEVQLHSILEEMLAPNQFERNVKPKPDSNEIVEFAIRLPGSKSQDQIWLPIDAKFPQEDYIKLQQAQDRSDLVEVETAAKGLEQAIIKSAVDIKKKYVAPPHTTEFAILFLPTEGLYAEALRRPKVVDELQRMRVTLAGPTTLTAILNALRMGFHTLAIEKRSSEVWEILGAVKTEFGKFGDVLSKLGKQLETAQNTISSTGVRTRAMERTLREVEELPDDKISALFDYTDSDPQDEE